MCNRKSDFLIESKRCITNCYCKDDPCNEKQCSPKKEVHYADEITLGILLYGSMQYEKCRKIGI